MQILLTPLGKAYSPRTIGLSRVRVVNGTLGVNLENKIRIGKVITHTLCLMWH